MPRGARLLSPLSQLKSNVFVFSDYYPRSLAGRRKFWAGITADFAGRGIPLSLLCATRTARVAKSEDKWIPLFFGDNNRVLARVAEAGWQSARFFSVNDGCKGGHNECANEDPCMGRWLGVMEDGGDYFTTHSKSPSRGVPHGGIPTSKFIFRTHRVHTFSHPAFYPEESRRSACR